MNKLSCLVVSILFLGITSVFAAAPAGYGLVWSDEFDKPTIDFSNWNFDVGVGVPAGWGNFEAEYYTDGTNFTVENGAGVLWAKHESYNGSNYTSCRMKTKGRQEFKYGYFEARIKTPKGNGLWPAFWTLGSNIDAISWPSCGEVELYEQRTGPQTYNFNAPACAGDNCYVTTCHYSGTYGSYAPVYNTKQNNYTACLCNDYHLYAIEWDSLKIQYFFDGVKAWEFANINLPNNFQSFHQPHFFIANIAIGGNYQGNNIDNSIFPQKMYIDYVRVYQKGAITSVNAADKGNASRTFALINPASAQLKLFNLRGELIADLSNKVRTMKSGGNILQELSGLPGNGAYVLRLTENGKTMSQKFVSAR